MRAVTYGKALKSVRADAVFALQSPKPDVRLFGLAAIAVAQSRPIAKAAMFSGGIRGHARVALLRAFEIAPVYLQQLTGLCCEPGKTPSCWQSSNTFKSN